ncbi:MAG: sporulation integral membrane protein YtvI [Oscillospiraceae bacterium]
MKPETMARMLLQTAFIAVCGLLFYLAVRYLLRWLLPFLLALILSAALEPVILWCRRHLRFRRGFTAAVCTILSVGLLGALLFRLCARLLQQATALLTRLPLLLAELPALLEHWQLRWDSLCAACPEPLRQWMGSFAGRISDGSLSLLTDWSGELLSSLPSLVAFLPDAVLCFATTVLAIFYTSSRYPEIRAFLRRQIPPHHRAEASGVKQNICATMGKWLRAQALLWLMTFLVLLAGLLLLRVPYALLLAFLIAFVDLLPVLGTGTVLLPWAALAFLAGRGPFAVGLLALQLVLLLQRSLLEPKLLASQAGLPPIAALFAMYLGFCSMGIAGMILFPMLLLLLKQLQDEDYIRLWK